MAKHIVKCFLETSIVFQKFLQRGIHLNSPHKHRLIRRLNISDRDEVISIRDQNELYGGYDYLPDYYQRFMECPFTEGYAATVDGLIVAVYFVILVDGGKTFIRRAARERKDYEGTGIIKSLDRYILDKFWTHGRKNSIVFDEENVKLLQKLEKGHLKLDLKKDYAGFKINTYPNIIDTTAYRNQYTGCTRVVSADDLNGFFTKKETCSRLFPEGIMFCDSVPYQTEESNIQLIICKERKIIGSFIPHCSLLTAGSYYFINDCIVYFLDVYGDCSEHIKEHIDLHLKPILNYRKDNLKLVIFAGGCELRHECTPNALVSFGFRGAGLLSLYCATDHKPVQK